MTACVTSIHWQLAVAIAIQRVFAEYGLANDPAPPRLPQKAQDYPTTVLRVKADCTAGVGVCSQRRGCAAAAARPTEVEARHANYLLCSQKRSWWFVVMRPCYCKPHAQGMHPRTGLPSLNSNCCESPSIKRKSNPKVTHAKQ